MRVSLTQPIFQFEYLQSCFVDMISWVVLLGSVCETVPNSRQKNCHQSVFYYWKISFWFVCNNTRHKEEFCFDFPLLEYNHWVLLIKKKLQAKRKHVKVLISIGIFVFFSLWRPQLPPSCKSNTCGVFFLRKPIFCVFFSKQNGSLWDWKVKGDYSHFSLVNLNHLLRG